MRNLLKTIRLILLALGAYQLYTIIQLIQSKGDPDIKGLRNTILKNMVNHQILIHWIDGKKNSEDFKMYFADRNVKRVALYGLGTVGLLLKDYIEDIASVELVYTVDNYNYMNHPVEFNVVPESKIGEMEPIDMMIITVPQYYTSIKEGLEGKYDFQIISILSLIN